MNKRRNRVTVHTGVNSNEIESAVSEMKNDFRYGRFLL